MEYTVKGLAELAGVSARTLRWYDAKGLLRPTRVSEAGYRLYDKQAVVRLQQILFYKELGLSLAAIGRILDDPDFNPREALQSHLLELEKRKERLEALILTIHKTLEDLQGGSNMSDEERFEAFKAERSGQNTAMKRRMPPTPPSSPCRRRTMPTGKGWERTYASL